ncbi:MAG TPA: hypothetical protein VGF32_14445 [Streptosporangiaceae bacterium]
MTSYVVSLDIAAALAPPGRCADCGSRSLAAVPGSEPPAFACRACGQTWQVNLGWVRRAGQQRLDQGTGPPSCGSG